MDDELSPWRLPQGVTILDPSAAQQGVIVMRTSNRTEHFGRQGRDTGEEPMSTESAIHNVGDIVRMTAANSTSNRPFVGQRFVVYEHVPASESDSGTAFYWAQSQNGGWDAAIDADKVELVTPAAQAPRIPTAEEIVEGLDSFERDGWFDIVDADPSDGNSRVVVGRTVEGLRFACTVTVTRVFETDC